MSKFSWILTISRPRFWTYLAGPWAVGMVTVANKFADFTDVLFWIGLLFFLWPANFFLYGLNDYGDRDTDQLNPKKGDYEGLYVATQNQNLLFICGLIVLGSIMFAWILPSFEARMVLLLWLCLSACYSLRPLRFKSRLFFDSFSNVLYILPGVIVFLAYSPIAELSWPLVTSAWAWAMGMHLFSALPDIDADRSAQVKTTAVWLGHKYATILTLSYFIIGTVLIATNVALWMGVVGFVAYCLPTVYVLFLAKEESQKLLRVYKIFPIINAICGGCIFVYIFFEHQLWG